MKVKPIFFLATVCFFSLFGCKDASKLESVIANIPLDLEVERFDRKFAEADVKAIPQLKRSYPYLFPEQYPDSLWVAKKNDTIQKELFNEVHVVFGDFETETADIASLFKHITYYFPNFKVPKVVTLTSDVEYESRIILTDTLLLIGLDNYLGADHRFYRSFSAYIAQQLDKRYLTSDIAGAFAKAVNAYPKNRTFLSKMLYYGKELYLKDLLLPQTETYQRINFTEEEYAWAVANESQIWRYFIERELLYSTETKLEKRFLDPAPFSKFGLEEIDNESPGRIGRFMGWQIVRSYMEKNPDTPLVELLDLPADELFKKSNYKPKK